MKTDDLAESRPSVYLASRCDALLEVLRFMNEGTKNKTATEKHLCFMAQIQFWEWEIDNLIYSFQTFRDRKHDWDATKALEESLQTQGFLVRIGEIAQIRKKRSSYNRNHPVEDVVAPTEKLKEVITTWNAFLDDCEKHIKVEDVDNAIKFGAQLFRDLNKFKKIAGDIT